MTERDWNDHYAQGFMPWDSDQPDPALVAMVASGALLAGRALDVGCGTGTHALWLATKGFDVLGIDLAPLAIERARVKGSGVSACRFEARDFLENPPPGHFDIVFDRGCFHVFDAPEARARFAARVADLLTPRGIWLSLIGSTEGAARDTGPPRRSARDVANAIEPVLEIVDLRAIQFDLHVPEPPAAWSCVSRRRAVPAQPSTGS
jgi:SAM-dependent methyltransferase